MNGSHTAHLEVRGLVKRFGSVLALRGVSLRIARGSIHALVGENGAGKSTLGKTIAGLQRPDGGELLLDGAPVAWRSPRHALSRGVTMISQEPALAPERPVIENVFLAREPRRLGIVDRAELRRRYDELTTRAGFHLPADEPAAALGAGEQQQVEILRALARDARLIVMDEPTASMSDAEAAALLAIVRSLAARGTTIVYVSHFLGEVRSIADTVTVLRDGATVETAAAASRSTRQLATRMLGRAPESAFPPRRAPRPGAAVVLDARELVVGDADPVSLQLHGGEIVGLAGLAGSGATELAQAIFGARRPRAGRVLVHGRTLAPGSPADAARAGIAMLPRSRAREGLLLDRSIAENVTLPHVDGLSSLGLVRRRRERDEVLRLMHELDVRAPGPAAAVSTLSGGNQQKVLFAKWLFRRPAVLIADEPTRGVDVGAKRTIHRLLARLADEGMAILLVSSELEEVLGMADRVAVLRGGRVVCELEGRQLSRDAVAAATFGGVATTSVRAA